MNWMEAYTAQPKAEKMGQCGFCGGNTRRGLRNEPAIVHVGVPVAGYPWHMAEREKEQ